jgi:phage baseplate assembly protein W
MALKETPVGVSELEIQRMGKGMDLANIFSTVTGKVVFNTGFDRINQALGTIFATAHGEVACLPTIGSNVSKFLFEPGDPSTASELETYIRHAVETLEPRITLKSVDINFRDNLCYVRCNYQLNGTNLENHFDYTVTQGSKGEIIF